MDDTIRCETEASSTVDFVDPTPVMNSADWLARQEFIQGATWSLKKLAAWLDVTNIVSDDEGAQRAVNETKSLIAAQARLAAAELNSKNDSR
jgi:hypothetical protein